MKASPAFLEGNTLFSNSFRSLSTTPEKKLNYIVSKEQAGGNKPQNCKNNKVNGAPYEKRTYKKLS